MTDKELMLKNKPYIAESPELQAERAKAKKAIRKFNEIPYDMANERENLLKNFFGKTGEHVYIEPPFYCDYGYNVEVGENFYANYDLIILDCAKVKIGKNAFIGPRVGIYAAGHPIDADVRNFYLEYGKNITIGDNVWIGGNTVINPGVTIGDNVVIGSGAVVTKDIPSNVIAAGVPCKVIREITEEDKIYWEKEKENYLKNKNF